jgi:hypothetical protein
MISVIIAQLVDLMMLTWMDKGTNPSKAILLPFEHLLKVSACGFCWLNKHATKLSSTQNE